MNNAAVTMLFNCNFHNNFGAEGGSINVQEGGTLIAINVNFSLDKGYLIVPDALIALVRQKELLDSGESETDTNSVVEEGEAVVKPDFTDELRLSYMGSLTLEDLIEADSIAFINSVANSNG